MLSYDSDWTYPFMILFNTAMGDILIQPIHIRESLVKALNIVEALTNRS